MVAASALMIRGPGGSRPGIRADSRASSRSMTVGRCRVVGHDRVLFDAQETEHDRRDQAGAVLARGALEHHRVVGIVGDQTQDRHDLLARCLEDRDVTVGERPVDEVVGLQRRHGRIDQRVVDHPDTGGLERRQRRDFHLVLPAEIDDEHDAALLDEVDDVARLDVRE